MEVLAGRVLLRPSNPARSRAFYRDVLGLAVSREYGDPVDPGMVFFLGGSYLEIAAHGSVAAGPGIANLWIQVRDVRGEAARLEAAGVTIVREPKQEFWGLIEMWIADPDGVPIVLVEVPDDHPLRRDQRTGRTS
jgi:catechol 2,3-dioxygenase-like lactoylglutathione lyase family enzyme